MTVAEVPARAALAGNPSDLYGGAVLAVPVRSLRARVEIQAAQETEIVGPGTELIDATLRRMHAGPVRVHCETSIPRSVGLAGSSAIVLATLRALEADLDPLELALLAQSIEADDLGIVAGLQDRAVQAFDQPVLVDVSGTTPVVTPLVAACPVRVVVAWLPSAAGDSGAYHRELRSAVDERWMPALATIARRAGEAFAAGDSDELRMCMAASATTRERVAPLPSGHAALVDVMRDAGLEPNSAGSGGSVAAVVTSDAALGRVSTALEAIGGHSLVAAF